MGGNRLSRKRYSCALSRAVGLGRAPPRGGTSPLWPASIKKGYSAPSEAGRLSARRLLTCWGLMKRGTKTKKGGRYAEPWVPVQEGRERLACLARTVETPQGRRLPPCGFPYRKSDDQGDRWFFKGEIFEMSGAVSADAWMTDFFKKK
jgi:hypothetical protein